MFSHITYFSATVLSFSTLWAAAAGWSLADGPNPDSPGEKMDVLLDGKPVARFVYGKGQMKPYLHVFGAEGELLTNGGLDSKGETTGRYPHHRGIFIGWKIASELGTYDLWHMNNGGRIGVTRIEKGECNSTSATFVADTGWHAGKSDSNGSDVLLTERRTLRFSRPDPKATQIDVVFRLTPVRDVSFQGDLQHSGVHFRAANEVAERADETSYIYEPEKVKGNDLKWCRLIFPIGKRWYSATEMNSPANPVEELSMRDYGRFGYFFKRTLKKGEPLELNYRFIVEEVPAPDENGHFSTSRQANLRSEAAARYRAFANLASNAAGK